MAFKYDQRAIGSGYYRVFVDGVQVSQHLQEREASEEATEQAINNPTAKVTFDHDYHVEVTVQSMPDPAPTPDPDPDPVPPDPDPPPTGRTLAPTLTKWASGNYGLAVALTDASGPVAGVPVTVTLESGAWKDGSGTARTATTDATGRVTPGDLLPTSIVRITADQAEPVSLTVPSDDAPVPDPDPDPIPPVDISTLAAVVGPLVAVGGLSAVAQFDQRFVANEQARFQDYLAGEANNDLVISANHYGGLRSRLQWAIRNGQVYGPAATDETTSAYARGRRIVLRYLQWSKANAFAIQPHNNTGLADMEALCRLEDTPDARSHLHVAAMMATYDPDGFLKMQDPNADARQIAVALQAVSAAHRLGVPFARSAANTQVGFDASPGSWKAAGARQITWLSQFGVVKADGSVPSNAHGGAEAYLFNAMLATELLRWFGFVDAQPAYRDLAQRIVDHLITMQGAAQTLPYLSTEAALAPDLSAFYVWPALVLWQETGQAKYRTFALSNLAATSGAFLNGVKQFNQMYSTGAECAEALLGGVGWRTPVDPPVPDPDPVPPTPVTGRRYPHARFSGTDYQTGWLPGRGVDPTPYRRWMADHFDLLVGGNDTGNTTDGAGTAAYFGMNPDLVQGGYDLLWNLNESTGRHDAAFAWMNGHGYNGEEGFCHRAGTSKTRANRITFTIPNFGVHHLVNPSYAGYIAYQKQRVAAMVAAQLSGARLRTVFYDNFGVSQMEGFIPASTLEYPARAQYHADLQALLRSLRTLVPWGRITLNEGVSTGAEDAKYIDAAGATFQEWLLDPVNEHSKTTLPYIAARAAAGTPIILTCNSAMRGGFIGSWPTYPGYMETRHGSRKNRNLMSMYTMGLMCIDPAAENVFMDFYLNGPDPSQYTATPHSDSWLKAFERDLGLATGAMRDAGHGTDGAGQEYVIYERRFGNAVAYWRPMPIWSLQNNGKYGNASAMSVNLPAGTWRELLPDGTLGPVSTSVSLRMSEGAIFVRGS